MMTDLEQRIRVQCGLAEVPDGEPEPWESCMDKLKGECDEVGNGVRVTWSEEFDSIVDYGVSVIFPWIDSCTDTGCAVFFPSPDPMSDKGDFPEPEWHALWDLLRNEHIVEVLFFDIVPPETKSGQS